MAQAQRVISSGDSPHTQASKGGVAASGFPGATTSSAASGAPESAGVTTSGAGAAASCAATSADSEASGSGSGAREASGPGAARRERHRQRPHSKHQVDCLVHGRPPCCCKTYVCITPCQPEK